MKRKRNEFNNKTPTTFNIYIENRRNSNINNLQLELKAIKAIANTKGLSNQFDELQKILKLLISKKKETMNFFNRLPFLENVRIIQNKSNNLYNFMTDNERKQINSYFNNINRQMKEILQRLHAS
tara:strand:+ start:3827 stop:4201 length:375 start_codon:yes stop_codon:yes gene_type:complete